MFSLTTWSLSACSAAISSSTGATILHGPHHSAQKSTSTGLSLDSTSLANVASVTVLVLAPTAASWWWWVRVPGNAGGNRQGRSVEQVRTTKYAGGPVLPLVRGEPPLRVERGG